MAKRWQHYYTATQASDGEACCYPLPRREAWRRSFLTFARTRRRQFTEVFFDLGWTSTHQVGWQAKSGQNSPAIDQLAVHLGISYIAAILDRRIKSIFAQAALFGRLSVVYLAVRWVVG
jgi:hypothetical protein